MTHTELAPAPACRSKGVPADARGLDHEGRGVGASTLPVVPRASVRLAPAGFLPVGRRGS